MRLLAPLIIVTLLVIFVPLVLHLRSHPSKNDGGDPNKSHEQNSPTDKKSEPEEKPVLLETTKGPQKATFGSGCFWCTEAVFQQLKGVDSVVSGYTGGETQFPTYRQVGTGKTGHAEVVQVTYDPKVISYPELLEVFWKTHDPTTKNRQGPDVGTQYRSAIFYHSPEQQELAELYKQKIDTAGVFSKPIVTEIVAATDFYPAEDYHQDFADQNAGNAYCQMVIGPKLDKLRKIFRDKVK